MSRTILSIVIFLLALSTAAGEIAPMLKTIQNTQDEMIQECYVEAPEDIADCVNTIGDSYQSLIVAFGRAAYHKDLAAIAADAVVTCSTAADEFEGLQFAAEWEVLDWINKCSVRRYRNHIKPLGGEQAVIDAKPTKRSVAP